MPSVATFAAVFTYAGVTRRRVYPQKEAREQRKVAIFSGGGAGRGYPLAALTPGRVARGRSAQPGALYIVQVALWPQV